MTSYNQQDSAALFHNTNKRGQSSPDYTGVLRVNGVEYFLSGWRKIASSGKRQGESFISLAINPKGAQHQYPPPQQQDYQQNPQQQQYQQNPPQQQHQHQPYQQTPQQQDGYIDDDILF